MPIYIINHEETTMLLFKFLLGCVYNMGTRFTTLWSYHVLPHTIHHTQYEPYNNTIVPCNILYISRNSKFKNLKTLKL